MGVYNRENIKKAKFTINIGKYTYGGEDITYIENEATSAGKSCNIGKFCSIAPRVTFLLMINHPYEWSTTYPFGAIFNYNSIKNWPNQSKNSINIGNDVWIGTGVTIMHGVTVGDGAIIGTNALVTKDVGPYQIVGGVPAKLIRNRFDDEIISLLLKLKWWEFDIKTIGGMVKDICQKPSKELLLKLLNKYRNVHSL
jgi:acetyltransferase-like isoleucine patch superfamily enzyme